jgi:hypothetical protein
MSICASFISVSTCHDLVFGYDEDFNFYFVIPLCVEIVIVFHSDK